MDIAKIIVRAAMPKDAEVIAQTVALAIGDEVTLRSYCGDDYVAVLTEIARRDDTQYSWRNAFIAEVDGVVAGAIVGYDGAQLRALRNGTFTVLIERIGRVPNILDET